MNKAKIRLLEKSLMIIYDYLRSIWVKLNGRITKFSKSLNYLKNSANIVVNKKLLNDVLFDTT